MREIILEKRYPHSREEDITDAFMRGYEIGKEQEHRWWSEFCANCKTEPSSSEKPNNCEDKPQYDFGAYADRLWKIAYERGKREALEQTEPTISKMEQVETMSCQECKHFHENAVMYLDQCDFCFKDCKYEPKDEPQTERSE